MNFDYFIFSEFWENNQFKIHGLWPQYKNGSWPQYCNNNSNINNISNIMIDMKGHWASNYKLWEHEWNKHGTCSINKYYIKDPLTYFATTLWIDMRINLNSKRYLLNGHFMKKNKLENILGGKIICKNKNILSEVRFIISKDMKYIERVPNDSKDTCTGVEIEF